MLFGLLAGPACSCTGRSTRDSRRRLTLSGCMNSPLDPTLSLFSSLPNARSLCWCCSSCGGGGWRGGGVSAASCFVVALAKLRARSADNHRYTGVFCVNSLCSYAPSGRGYGSLVCWSVRWTLFLSGAGSHIYRPSGSALSSSADKLPFSRFKYFSAVRAARQRSKVDVCCLALWWSCAPVKAGKQDKSWV